ncbi:hypothetical protein LY90DRAFT_519018 [Neocallimastix californiae]|uniref:Periplasmic binding protein-like II n=1 Tax=Neocallimastix californiae TaxID=1754190 RepID=A0A1Y1ZE34_9FUNG|nr:hypothetical protein LY90DRAFT_519018 [Neocallimastix californiae]|eukprot:ORY08501.1 hypothetical protein LY90DRAFT_519018 [Neocallimastix californiae]
MDDKLNLGFIHSNSIVINSVVLTYSDNDDLFKRVNEEFNKYSLEKQLNITLNVITYTTSNTTNFEKEYGATIDQLLYKRSKKFDVFFYDVVYTKRYSNYLLDLYSWFPREHIELYSKGVALKTCTSNGKWIGLMGKNVFVPYWNLYILLENQEVENSFSINSLLNGNAIYLKYWYYPHGDAYKKSVLVGKNEGVSGSTIGGYNIGINKYIDYKHKLAAIEVLKYFTSKEFQKNFTIAEKYFTGISSLYDDEEVCSAIACDLAKQFQPIARPLLTEDYDDYSKEFRGYIFKFLYGNETASKVLSDIVDMTKVYEIVLNTDTTKIGYIFFIISCGLTILMPLSLLFLLHPRAVRTFRFLSTDFWVITIIGCILPLGSILAGSIDLRSKFNNTLPSNVIAGSKAHLQELTLRERLMFYHNSKVIIGLKVPSKSKSNSKVSISAMLYIKYKMFTKFLLHKNL